MQVATPLRRMRRIGLSSVLLIANSVALAAPYPNKAIHMIVPYAPGGGTDISARVIAQHVSEALGQPIIIDNRPGAGTMLGTALAAKAAPDGYTIIYGSVTHTIVPALYKTKITYDPVKDFTPISEIATFPFVVLVQATASVKSIKDLVDVAKASPGKLNYASVGNGTGTHLTGEMFKLLTRTDIVHVPYNGSGPAITALLGGQVDVAISDPPPAIEHIKSGKLLALAVTTPKRSSSLPDVPTIAEAGVPGFDFTSWWGVFGPAGLPRPIVDRLQKEFAKALQLPDVKATLASFAAEPVGSTPEAFAQTVTSEIVKYDKVVRDAKIKLD